MQFGNIARNKSRTINMLLVDDYENYILQKYEIYLDVNVITGYKNKDGN